MELEPKPGDLALVAPSGNLGLVVRVDGGWYYLTFEGSDWQTYFRRDQIRVISRG
jgi:hypothetical protein